MITHASLKVLAAAAIGFSITNAPRETLPPMVEPGAPAFVLSEVAAELLETPFELGCQDCTDCTSIRHEASSNPSGIWGPDATHTPTNHGCSSVQGHGNCDDPGNHVEGCAFTDEDGLALTIADIVNTLAVEDAKGIAALIDQYPSVLAMNRKRMAVQVFGCSGEIIAHLPLVAIVD